MFLTTVRISLLLILALAAITSGFRAAFVEQVLIGDMLLEWTTTWSVAVLCVVDSHARKKRVPLCAGWMFLLVPHFSAFAYATWARGWRGFLIAVTLYVVWSGIAYAGIELGYATLYD